MITKAALLLFRGADDRRELLFTREAGKSYYAFPGGKQDPGETVEDALHRELDEELGVAVMDVQKLGVVSGQTPDGRDIEMHLYSGEISGEPHAQDNIEEITWMSQADIAAHQDAMTPMTLEHVLPFLRARGIW